MKVISNYSQPDFYRFSEDSIELVNFANSVFPNLKGDVLDLCAGCGVIGIEASNRFPHIQSLSFLELQKDFVPHLEKNISNAEISNSQIFQNSIGQIDFSEEFDVVFCNPPYFPAGDGRPSPNVKKQICRTFEIDGFIVLFEKLKAWTKPGGHVFLALRNLDPMKKYEKYFGLEKKVEIEGCSLVFLTRLDVD